MSAPKAVRRREPSVPRGAVLALCALLLALPAGLATGHELRYDGQDRWVHHHTTNYTTCNDIDQDMNLKAKATEAREDWHDLRDDTGVRVPPQAVCHPSNNDDRVHIELKDGNFGNTGWRASVHDSSVNNAPAGYHARHTHALFNLYHFDGATTNYVKRTLACKVIGQTMGLATASGNEGSNNDCLSFNGNIGLGNYTNQPGPHSVAEIAAAYSDHGPELDVAGSLAEAADERRILHERSYELEVDATAEDDYAPARLEAIEVRVNEDLVVDHDCEQEAECALTDPFEFDPDELELDVGAHEVVVTARDSAGFETEQMLVAYVPDRRGIGQLDHAVYVEPESDPFLPDYDDTDPIDPLDTELDDEDSWEVAPEPPANQVMVNVATGNSVLSATDVSLEHEMTAGDITRVLNSLSPTALGAFGAGWRLGLGEDVRLDDTGHGSITISMPSGVRALFVPTENSCEEASSYTPGPGVSATLSDAAGGAHELFVPELDRTYVFSAEGVLERIDSSTGPVHLAYSDGLLDELSFEDGSPNMLLTRNGSGYITTIAWEDVSEPLATYSYDNDRLHTHTDAHGITTTYTYDHSGVVTGVTDDADTSLSLTHQSDLRTTEVEGAGVEPADIAVEYFPSTTLVDEGDQVAAYELDNANVDRAQTVGGSPPTVDADIALPADELEPLDSTDPFELELSAYSATGVDHLALVVDGGLEWDAQVEDEPELCAVPPCTSVQTTVLLDVAGMPVGDYAVQVIATDVLGRRTEEHLRLRAPEEPCDQQDPDPDADDWSPPAFEGPPSIDELAAATAFRESVGLSTGNVAASFDDPSALDALQRHGVPLWDYEEDALAFRETELSDAMSVIEQYGKDHPGEYAGTFIDQSGGVVRALFTDDIAHHDTELSNVFPYPEYLSVVEAEYPWDTLNATADAINEDHATLEAAGVFVASVFVSALRNRVDITLETLEDGHSELLSLEDATELLEGEYGGGLEVHRGGVEPDAQKPRFKAGRGLIKGANEPPFCTTGFGVRWKKGGHWNWGLLTAAHCDTGAAGEGMESGKLLYYRFFNRDWRIGRAHKSNQHRLDAVMIGSLRRRAPLAVFRRPKTSLPVKEVQRRSQSRAGQRLCVYSRMEQEQICGIVEGVATSRSSGIGSNRMRVVSTCDYQSDQYCVNFPHTVGGDSGGPWYQVVKRSVRAVGVHHGRAGKRPWLHYLEHVGVISKRRNLRVLTR